MDYIPLKDLQKDVERANAVLGSAIWIDYQKGRSILSMANDAGLNRAVVTRILKPFIQAELDKGRAELRAGGFGSVFAASDAELHRAGLDSVSAEIEIPAGSESAWRPPGYEPPVHPDWDSDLDDD